METIKENWSAEQVARRLGLSTGAFETQRWRGVINIPPIRTGRRSIRFDPDDVEKWILEHKEEVPEVKKEGKPADKPAGRAKRQRRLRSGK